VDKRVFPGHRHQQERHSKEELLLPKEERYRVWILRKVRNPRVAVETWNCF